MSINLGIGDTQYIINEAKKHSILRNELAYILATTYHETAHTMKPVREYGGEAYLRSKKYYPYVGMGYVQLTWLKNYRFASEKLGINFEKEPRLLLLKENAAKILIIGMIEGWFTGKKLSDYISLKKSDFVNARRIINGTDKADLIAGYARTYDQLLLKNGYGVDQEIVEKANDILPEPEKEKPLTKSTRFITWLTGGGLVTAMPLVDWRVQLFLVAGFFVVMGYAVFTMPQAKEKLQKLTDNLLG